MNNPKMRKMLITAPVTTAVKASRVIQDITYTALVRGLAGNSITVAYTAGGTAGAEVVTVTGTAISVQIQTGVSTATQVRAAVLASVPAVALITPVITGTAGTAQVTAAAVALQNGTDITVAGFDASQILSITETAVGTWLVLLKYPFNVNTECMGIPASKTIGVQAYVHAVDHDRITIKAVTMAGSVAADCNWDLEITGNDHRLQY